MSTKLKDERVYEFMRGFISKHNYSPSIREVCKDVGISSTATAYDCIERLIKRGRLKKAEGKKRAYEVIESEKGYSTISVPLLGKITAGEPIEARQNIEEMIPIPEGMFGNGEIFMLRVSGESMINAGIFDGDSIIVRRQSTAENGDIVAALIENEATVKRFYKEKGRFRLQPENDSMMPIYSDNVEIIGIVTGLIRKL